MLARRPIAASTFLPPPYLPTGSPAFSLTSVESASQISRRMSVSMKPNTYSSKIARTASLAAMTGLAPVPRKNAGSPRPEPRRDIALCTTSPHYFEVSRYSGY